MDIINAAVAAAALTIRLIERSWLFMHFSEWMEGMRDLAKKRKRHVCRGKGEYALFIALLLHALKNGKGS